MPPKPIISKRDIINAAIQLVRENGINCVSARSLANVLNCSTKPLFRIYKNMEELKSDIIAELDTYYNFFMNSRMTEENRLLSQGVAYIEFAQKEKMIFSTLFMNRTMEGLSLHDVIHAEWNKESIENARAITGLPMDKAELLFINIWLYSHGIATQIVTNGIAMSLDTVTKLLINAFEKFSIETTKIAE